MWDGGGLGFRPGEGEEATILEVQQGCPIPRVRDVKTPHRKKEEGGPIK